MDILHLSYNEVVNVIPYRNLLIMQKDKMHTVYGGTKVNKTSGKDMMARRMGGLAKKNKQNTQE